MTLIVPGLVHHDHPTVTLTGGTRRSPQVIGAGLALIGGETTVTTESHRDMILSAQLPQIERYRRRRDLAVAALRPGTAESVPSPSITSAAEWSVRLHQSQGTHTLSSNGLSGDLGPRPLHHRDLPNPMLTTELHG